MAITLRSVKLAALTHNELDGNFTDLDTRVHAVTKGGTGASTAADARTNLGLGTAAVEDVGTASGDIPQILTQSLTVDGDFTSGTITLMKIGRVVTVSWTSLSHASAATPSNGTALPTEYRPSGACNNGYTFAFGSVENVHISTIGAFSLRYLDYSGSTVNKTVASPGSITYITA